MASSSRIVEDMDITLEDGPKRKELGGVKGMSPAKHELVCILLVAFGFVLIMNGYDISAFITESVLHSVHVRDPHQIDQYAGYYGPTVMYASFAFSTLISPWICFRLGAKRTLVLGTLPFTLYLAVFFHVNSLCYYLAQVLLGIGYGLFYNGLGQYISEHSTRETLSRNSVMASAIGNQSMLLGGILLLFINWMHPPATPVSALETPSTGPRSYRNFSDSEINLIFGTLLTSSVLANILCAFLPTKQYNSLAQQEPAKKTTFSNQMKMIFGTILEKRILALLPFFMFYGFNVTFWVIVFPTSFAFSGYLAGNHYLPALYSIALGIGNLLVGFYIHQMSKKNNSFGLMPTMLSQIPLSIIVYVLIVLGTPNRSTISPTMDPALLITPAAWYVLVIGVLHGMIDCCNTTMRSFVSTIAVPKKRLQVYSIGKLFQSLTTCLGSFLAPQLSVYGWIILLAGSQIVAATGFIFVCREIKREEEASTLKDTEG